MKRVGFLWDKIISIENIKEAHKHARKDKSFYREVKMVNADLDFYANEIREMLINKSYKVSDYRIQVIDDKGKERKLMKLQYYPDRIIQWAIMLQLEPVKSAVFNYYKNRVTKKKSRYNRFINNFNSKKGVMIA